MREVAGASFVATPSAGAGFAWIDPCAIIIGWFARDGTPVYVLGGKPHQRLRPVLELRGRRHPYLPRAHGELRDADRAGLHPSRLQVGTRPVGHRIGCLEPHGSGASTRDRRRLRRPLRCRRAQRYRRSSLAPLRSASPREKWRPGESWDDNPYSARRGGPRYTFDLFLCVGASRARAPEASLRRGPLGSSSRLLAVDLLNEPEWDGENPGGGVDAWAVAMSEAWRVVVLRPPRDHRVRRSPRQHREHRTSARGTRAPRTTSCSGIATERTSTRLTRWQRRCGRQVEETWGFGKPVVCGEFGYGGEDHTTFDHTHDGIWSLLFSGAGRPRAHRAPVESTRTSR